MIELSLKDHPGVSCWVGVLVLFICNQAESCCLQDQVFLVSRNPTGREDSQGSCAALEFSRSWITVQEGVNESEVITALDILTDFKSRLKLMNAEESTMITDGSCISCLHSRRPSNPSRL